MPALESQLVISADDRTAAAFASVQGKLAQLQSTVAAFDRVGLPALANAGAFAGPGAALKEHGDALVAQGKALGGKVRRRRAQQRQRRPLRQPRGCGGDDGHRLRLRGDRRRRGL